MRVELRRGQEREDVLVCAENEPRLRLLKAAGFVLVREIAEPKTTGVQHGQRRTGRVFG